ncbi:MAG: hypothetical protein ACXAD7_27190 [Candidatus Kariarchaeaceae archaeon]|jgi:hypothetical protein
MIIILVSIILVISPFDSYNRVSYHFDPPIFGHSQSNFTDNELLRATYSSYRIPSDFYYVELIASTYYITANTKANTGHLQLCTDNYTQASEWSNTSAENMADFRPLISDRETEKFYEFYRKRIGVGYQGREYNDHILLRVHKCSYYTPGDYNITDLGMEIGYYNLQTITLNSSKEFVEYLFYRVGYEFNDYGMRVLSSFNEQYNNSIIHYIYFIQQIIGDFGMCDEVGLIREIYEINLTTRLVRNSFERIRSIDGECH